MRSPEGRGAIAGAAIALLVFAWLEALLALGALRPAGPLTEVLLEIRAVPGTGTVHVLEVHRLDTGAPLALRAPGPSSRWRAGPDGWHPTPGAGDAPLQAVAPLPGPVRVVLRSEPGAGRAVVSLGAFREEVALARPYQSRLADYVDPRPGGPRGPLPQALAAALALALGALVARRGLPGWAWASLTAASLAALLVLVAVAWYPGHHSIDTLLQLRQVLEGRYLDHHPPVLAGLWAALIALTGLEPSLWLLHLGLLGAGLAAWGRAAWLVGARAWLLGLPLVLASPWALACLGAVWKDVGFAGALLLASGLVAVATVQGRAPRTSLPVILAALFYAGNVRHNGLPAVLPVAWMLTGPWLAAAPGRRAWLARGAATLGLALAVAVGGQAFQDHVLRAERAYLSQTILLHDLAAIAVLADRNLFPPYVRAYGGYDERRLREEYWRSIHVYHGNNHLMLEGYPPPLPVTNEPAQIAELRAAWLKAIAAEPITYLRHRASLFRSLMRHSGDAFVQPPRRPFRDEWGLWALTPLQREQAAALVPEPPPAADARLLASRWAEAWRHSGVYNGWLMGGLDLAVLVAALAWRRRPALAGLAAMLAASSLLYLGLYLFVQVWSEFRYLYWSGLAGLMAAWALAAARAAAPRVPLPDSTGRVL